MERTAASGGAEGFTAAVGVGEDFGVEAHGDSGSRGASNRKRKVGGTWVAGVVYEKDNTCLADVVSASTCLRSRMVGG